jgi:hypothetical protein
MAGGSRSVPAQSAGPSDRRPSDRVAVFHSAIPMEVPIWNISFQVFRASSQSLPLPGLTVVAGAQFPGDGNREGHAKRSGAGSASGPHFSATVAAAHKLRLQVDLVDTKTGENYGPISLTATLQSYTWLKTLLSAFQTATAESRREMHCVGNTATKTPKLTIFISVDVTGANRGVRKYSGRALSTSRTLSRWIRDTLLPMPNSRLSFICPDTMVWCVLRRVSQTRGQRRKRH